MNLGDMTDRDRLYFWGGMECACEIFLGKSGRISRREVKRVFKEVREQGREIAERLDEREDK